MVVASTLGSILSLGLGCQESTKDPIFSVPVQVVDEAGEAIVGATVDLGSTRLLTDARGRAVIGDLESPVLAVIGGDGFISEPAIIGRTNIDSPVRIRLFSKSGTRWVMHSGGDAMFGRRYVEPSGGEPWIRNDRAAEGARFVVANIARAFSLADLGTANLETVVSELPDDAIYPGKRYIVSSHPDTLAGLEALSIDLVTLGNNRARDYLDRGIAETIDNLHAHGIEAVGAALDEDAAAAPVIMDIAGVRVASLSWTTITGSSVNDAYPGATAVAPVECQADPPTRTDCFMYEERIWSFPGSTLSATAAPRRIGEAWDLFINREDGMSESERAQAWASLYQVYPELQDWVARRGHGGAAMWDTSVSKAEISKAKTTADVVVVHVHSGYQYQPVASSFARRVARHAIDAGADIVIGHHPHVLQGVEWYKGKLIVHSLGNFIYDQDFLATFPSAFLRTVWDGSTLLEARFVLTELIDYRPTPIADRAATRTARMLWERSTLEAYSDRDSTGVPRTFAESGSVGDPRFAHSAFAGHPRRARSHAQPRRRDRRYPAGDRASSGRGGRGADPGDWSRRPRTRSRRRCRRAGGKRALWLGSCRRRPRRWRYPRRRALAAGGFRR